MKTLATTLLLLISFNVYSQFLEARICESEKGFKLAITKSDSFYYTESFTSQYFTEKCFSLEELWKEDFYLVARRNESYYIDGMNYLVYNKVSNPLEVVKPFIKGSDRKGEYLLFLRYEKPKKKKFKISFKRKYSRKLYDKWIES